MKLFVGVEKVPLAIMYNVYINLCFLVLESNIIICTPTRQDDVRVVHHSPGQINLARSSGCVGLAVSFSVTRRASFIGKNICSSPRV